MVNNKIIFWDMDETLGYFRHLVEYEKLEEVPASAVKFGLKNGIDELLSELSADGFKHYVTTSGVRSYANIALNATGIWKHFNKVYAREDICPKLGLGYYGDKDYNVPLKDIGVSIERAKSDVLIIGNSEESDVPFNIKEIVSIIDAENWQHNARLSKKLIYLLLDKGEGDFNQGFHKLYAESKKIGPWAKHLLDRGKMTLEEDTILRFEFMQDRQKCSQAPMVIVEKADKYESRD